MIITDLFTKVLIEPADRGCNELFIASGYATSAMAFHHLNALQSKDYNNIKVNLILGMSPVDGISLSNHKGFQKIMNDDFHNKFECSYRFNNPPFHTKLYIWKKDGQVNQSFLGSANYTQTAFNSRRQLEALTNCSNDSAIDYYNGLIDDSIYCTHPDSENILQIYNDNYNRRRARELSEGTQQNADFALSETVTISFLARNGTLPQRSGLNWGQRPEQHREPNQAYIRIPANIYRTHFFPRRGTHFTLLTDDNRVLICSRAQENGKAIHTPHNNSLIGEYFRNRLNVPNGAPVLLHHLTNYGRTNVTFYKIDNETFFMDFSV